MPTLDPRERFDDALADLADLVGSDADLPGSDAQQRHRLRVAVAELQRRLREDRIRILVAGESKRGKSTFTNALIGRAVLPMGVTPLTAVATTLTYGHPDQVRIAFADGSARTEPVAALSDLVTEDGNPGNRLGLRSVVVQLDAALLTEGIELVDTPGTGSVHQANTAEAEIAYQSMDAAIFVLTADPPISAAERELLERILPSSVATFVVLNKADRLSVDELRTALAFTSKVVTDAAGRELPIYVCSARQALGVDPVGALPVRPDGTPMVDGIESFLADFTAYLRTGRATALLTSLRRHAAGVIAQLLDEVTVTVRAAELQRTADAGKVALFRGYLDEMQRHQTDADDLVRGESRRLLTELNSDAARMEDETARRVVVALRAWLGDDAPPAGAALETEGHRIGSDLIAAEVETWRSVRAGILQKRLDELDARLREGLDRDIADLRPVARELLGIDLATRPTDVALAPSQRFYYQFRIDLDAAGMLAAGIRHRLPGQLGRSRAVKYLLEQMDLLARQQVGRARADLQQRLNSTAAAMRSALTQRYADHNARMLDALVAATRLDRASAGDAATERARLAKRRSRLAAIAGEVRAA